MRSQSVKSEKSVVIMKRQRPCCYAAPASAACEQGAGVAEGFDISDAGEVALVEDTLPDDFGGIALDMRHAVDTKKDVTGVDEVLHERDAHLAHAAQEVIAVTVVAGHHLGKGVRCRPPLGDGGHETIDVARIVPVGVLVLRPPDEDEIVSRKGNAPRVFGFLDAEELEVFFYGGELLSFVNDVRRLLVTAAHLEEKDCRNSDDKGSQQEKQPTG